LIEGIGVMKDDKEVYKMVKKLAQCTLADKHMNLSIVMIKHLQGLVYWVNNCTLHQQTITMANFTVEQMNGLSIKDLSKFNPNEFETCHLSTSWQANMESQVNHFIMLSIMQQNQMNLIWKRFVLSDAFGQSGL
jgi:hypothetical protein